MSIKKLFKDKHPGTWVPSLYFAEGLPFVVTAVVSVLMYKSLGLSDGKIAFFTSWVMLPWTIKPIWGPFLEMFKTKKFFVLVTQFLGGIGFAAMALVLPLDGYLQYSLILFFLIAFNSATHDIAADGVYINTLVPKQQAQFVGWQGAFYNVAKVFSQGALVYIAGQLEISLGITHAWMIIMGTVGVILFLLGLYHIKSLPSGGTVTGVQTTKEAYNTFVDVLKTFLQKKHVIWGISFIILFRSAEGQLAKIVPLFLRATRDVGGLGLETSDVGIVYGIFGAGAFVLGSILGGYFVASRRLKNVIFPLCLIFNIPDVVYLFLAWTTPESFAVICGAVTIEWFGYGFGFVGVILFMMQQIAPGKYKMAHYAFATAIMNLGFLIPGSISGFLSDYLGYKLFFAWVMIATIPSFLVAWFVPFSDLSKDSVTLPDSEA